MFSKSYRYEAERKAHVKFIFEHASGNVTDNEYVKYLVKRDQRLWLDIESNCFLGYRPDLVYQSYPDALYILTLSDPLSWLNSIV